LFCSVEDYYSGDQIKKMRWAGNFALMGERRGTYRVLVGKTEGKSPLKDLGIDGKLILI
jgi:hypothetical protein